ncbi:MAG: ELKS/Rab6-interacting/CAST family protein [Planctomycetes bacterium]|jgi:hypothetical protein|nr:ELKS/Rab6-interacting/CAST family protein [Planctomycetota bacterium]
MKRGSLALACLLFAACSEVAPTPTEELIAELRAWRRQQAATQAVAPPVADAAAARGAITESLQPLREIVVDLSARQRELQDRQLALTQEMQRWSQLLVESVQGARGEQSQAIAARLQQLEQSLREQDARHRQVEDLMGGALERTAAQLEAFLQRVSGTTAGGGSATAAPVEASAARFGDALPTRTGPRLGLDRWGWFLLVTMAGCAGWWFVQRARRSPRSAPTAWPEPVDATNHDGAALAAPTAAPTAAPANALSSLDGLVRPDAGAQEIWAAAALLGEAVGRLRQNQPGHDAVDATGSPPVTAEVTVEAPAAGNAAEPDVRQPTTTPPSEPQGQDPELDELFVIDGLDPEDLAVAERGPERRGPQLWRCLVAGGDATRAATALPPVFASEPAVLQKPAPVVRPIAGGIELRFALLPGTPGGEASRIEQRLRAALRTPNE